MRYLSKSIVVNTVLPVYYPIPYHHPIHDLIPLSPLVGWCLYSRIATGSSYLMITVLVINYYCFRLTRAKVTREWEATFSDRCSYPWERHDTTSQLMNDNSLPFLTSLPPSHKSTNVFFQYFDLKSDKIRTFSRSLHKIDLKINQNFIECQISDLTLWRAKECFLS